MIHQIKLHKYMYKFFISFTLVFALSCQDKVKYPKLSKELQQKYVKPLNGLWYINGVIGANFQDTIKLTKVVLKEGEQMSYGTSIDIKDGIYEDSYGAPCGNDCFPSSNGKFTMISENQLTVFVKNFKQWGDCENFDKTLNKDLGIYTLMKISDTEINLVKNKK